MIDEEVLTSAGFLILVAIAVGATLLGFIFAKRADMEVMKTWQLIVTILAELIACYIFASRS